jgi:hypothetical protein
MIQEQQKRANCWLMDSEFKPTMSFLDSWSVIGNNSEFIYKDKMNEQQAKAYAEELNQNKQYSKRYE